MPREIKTIIVDWWTDHPTSASVMDDAMLPVAQGIYYHARLNMTFMILSDMPVAVASNLR